MEQTKNGLTSLTQDALEHSPSHRKCRIIFVESVHRVSVCNLGVLTPMESKRQINRRIEGSLQV